MSAFYPSLMSGVKLHDIKAYPLKNNIYIWIPRIMIGILLSSPVNS
jgi:hypothetical protein